MTEFTQNKQPLNKFAPFLAAVHQGLSVQREPVQIGV